jgi:hypothetical protein
VPTPFAITAAAPSLRLGEDRTGSATFTVSNTADQAIRAEAKIWTEQPEASSWMRIDGLAEQEFPPGASRQFTVRFTPPATVPAGSYAFRLDLISRERPDDESAMGQAATVEVPPPPPVTPKRRRFPWWLVAVAVAVLVVAGLVIRACTGPEQLTVPNVVGRNLDAARAELQKANLTPDEVTTRPSGEPPNTVIEQTPAAEAKAREGDRVDLVVAVQQPAGEVVVPRVVGLSLSTAQARLAQLNFTPGRVTTEITGINQPLAVLSQSPQDGTSVPEGQSVDLSVEQEPIGSASKLLTWVLDKDDGEFSRRPVLNFDNGAVHDIGIGEGIPDDADVMLVYHPSPDNYTGLLPLEPALVARTIQERIDLRDCRRRLDNRELRVSEGITTCLLTDQGRLVQLSLPSEPSVDNDPENKVTTVRVSVSYTIWAP